MDAPITLSTYLALFGLFMAVVELYIPQLSANLERFLSASQQKSIGAGRAMRRSPGVFRAWLMGTWAGRLYSFLWKPIVFIALPLLIAALSFNWEQTLGIAAVALAVVVIPPLALNYLLNYLWIFTLIFSVPLWLFDWTMRTLNFIGKGKALSGVGLVMALHGLIQPIFWP